MGLCFFETANFSGVQVFLKSPLSGGVIKNNNLHVLVGYKIIQINEPKMTRLLLWLLIYLKRKIKNKSNTVRKYYHIILILIRVIFDFY